MTLTTSHEDRKTGALMVSCATSGGAAAHTMLRHQPVRVLVLAHTWLRAGFLATIALL